MKLIVILAINLLVIASVFSLAPIAQDPAYHLFADQRGGALFPNVLNVVSNAPYLLIGVAGLRLLVARKTLSLAPRISAIYGLFFAAVLLTGIGSCYYHWSPDNASLMWDRLPMAVAFISFFCIVIAEFIDDRLALILFPALLFFALASVIHWYWSETLGEGDLRLYLVVQFLPIILIPVILLLYRSRYTRANTYWWVLACYLLAKLFELFDAELYQLGQLLSGHTLKHLVAALGLWLFYRMLQQRGYRAER